MRVKFRFERGQRHESSPVLPKLLLSIQRFQAALGSDVSYVAIAVPKAIPIHDDYQ